MIRIALLVACLAACKERGTITIDLSLTCPSVTATRVRFQAIKNGSCNSCSCTSCVCENTSEQQCIADVPCSGSGCPLADAQENGIDFDPPSAGRYALTYQFLGAGTAAPVVASTCTTITVDADGTASSTAMPAPTCCM